MKDKFRRDVAQHLASLAQNRATITYGELAKRFGGVPRGWGDALGGIAIRCYEAKLPLLSVLVVNAATDEPSPDALLYEDLGVSGSDAIKAEQERCFCFDWSKTPLAS